MEISKARETPQARYDRKNRVPIMLKLNRNTDADILAMLDEVPNKQGYIKQLIRADIATKKAIDGGSD